MLIVSGELPDSFEVGQPQNSNDKKEGYNGKVPLFVWGCKQHAK